MKIVRTVSACAVFAVSLPLYAGILFGNPDLSGSDEVLFTVRQDIPGTDSYSSLFSVKIADGTAASLPEILTCYPEQMELLSGGTVLQLRSRYGTARYSSDTQQ